MRGNHKPIDPQHVEDLAAQGLDLDEIAVGLQVARTTLLRQRSERPEIRAAIVRGHQRADKTPRPKHARKPAGPRMSKSEKAVLACIRDESIQDFMELQARTNLSCPTLETALYNLENEYRLIECEYTGKLVERRFWMRGEQPADEPEPKHSWRGLFLSQRSESGETGRLRS